MQAYAGQTVRFRFHHASNGSINGYFGVAIDNFTLYGTRMMGAVSGTVTASADASPLQNATVFLYPSGSNEVTAQATTAT